MAYGRLIKAVGRPNSPSALLSQIEHARADGMARSTRAQASLEERTKEVGKISSLTPAKVNFVEQPGLRFVPPPDKLPGAASGSTIAPGTDK